MRQSHKITLLVVLFLSIVSSIAAAEMESPRFKIDSPSIDFTSPENNTTSTKPNSDEATQFESSGVIVMRDGQNKDSTPFRFMMEKSLFNMENLIPNTPSKVSSNVSVSGGRTVYQVLVSETDLLHKLSGETIPDTACSTGKKCTPYVASAWNSVSSYGLGYSLSGQDIPQDFKNDEYFRPFSNSKKNNPQTVLMTANDKTDERHSTITVKTIVSAVQADGTYENTLNFVAVPGY